MQVLSTALILIAGVVNLIPVSGLLSAGQLQSLYGIAFDEPNLQILMRHRAVLFEIVGGLLVAGAFHLPLRRIAIAVGLLSMLSFVVVAWIVGDYNAALRRVVYVDVAASIALLAAAAIDWG